MAARPTKADVAKAKGKDVVKKAVVKKAMMKKGTDKAVIVKKKY